MPPKRRAPRLARLRRRVHILNSIYGLLVQGVDGLCARLLMLEQDAHEHSRDIEDRLDGEYAGLLEGE